MYSILKRDNNNGDRQKKYAYDGHVGGDVCVYLTHHYHFTIEQVLVTSDTVQAAGVSDLVPKWVRLHQNGINLGLFSFQCIFILAVVHNNHFKNVKDLSYIVLIWPNLWPNLTCQHHVDRWRHNDMSSHNLATLRWLMTHKFKFLFQRPRPIQNS